MPPVSPDSPGAGAPDLPLRRAAWLLFSIFLATALVRGLLLRFIPHPFILTDETLYLNVTRSLAAGGPAAWNGVPVSLPSWLYPWLMSFSLGLGDWPQVYGGMRLTNVLLVALIPVATYLLAREAGSRRAALWAAGLAALMPGLNYSTAIMTENLYYPLFGFGCWMIFRAVLRPSALFGVLTGLVLGLAFHAKANGIILAPIAGLTAMVFEALRLPATAPAAWLRAYGARLLVHAPMAVAWAAVIAVRGLELHFVQKQAVSLDSMFGFYLEMAKGQFEATPLRQLASLGGYLAGWVAIASFVMPFALFGPLRRLAREAAGERIALLRLLALVVCLVLLWMAARHPLQNDDAWRFYERYLFPSLPLLAALFCVAPPAWLRRPAGRVAVTLWIVAFAAAAFTIARRTIWYSNNDSPTLTFYPFFHEPALFQPLVLLAWGAALVACAGLLVFGRNAMQQRLGLAAFFVAGNIGWVACEKQFCEPFYELQNKVIRRMARTVEPGDRVHVVKDGFFKMNENRVVWGVDACFDGYTLHLEPQLADWSTRPWDQALAEFSAPGRSGRDWVVAVKGTLPGLEPMRTMDGVGIYLVPVAGAPAPEPAA